ILEIDRQQIYSYNGNYDYYLRRRQERLEALSSEHARLKNLLRREQEWINRTPSARTGKARYRINAFHDLKDRASVNLSEREVNLNVKSSYIGSKIFVAHDISKRFSDKVILDNFNYTFARYDRLGIIGPNGIGKTTFIRMLQGFIKPDSGYFEIGETVRFGYYSQDGINFDNRKKVIDAVNEIAEDIVVNDNVHYSPLQFLQYFLFTPADQQKYIAKLSGGERCRLHLATVLMRSPNFLILDEPTNDLDIITLSLLEEYLLEFKGCLIVISHDRYFLDRIVDHVFVFHGDGNVEDFPGNFSQYRAKQAEKPKEVTNVKQENKPQRQKADRPVRMTFKERKEFEELTEELDALNAEKAELEAIFNSGEQIADIAERSRRYDELLSILDEKEFRWLELSEKE
ncbi:MAG: ABC-F family ATP-binding cassette domain-containing protein, partial [Muribaculaceae bacterium]|nr:ABC-F family ATP-binding cassette domain-containing protein [Muribaculaceae bacterium]